MLNASGRVVVAPCELGGAASRSAAFDIADQPVGMYIVIGRCRGATLTRKFVKRRKALHFCKYFPTMGLCMG